MWIVCKYKSKELSTLKKNLCDKLNDEIKFYYPKIKYQKTFKKKLKYYEKMKLLTFWNSAKNLKITGILPKVFF